MSLFSIFTVFLCYDIASSDRIIATCDHNQRETVKIASDDNNRYFDFNRPLKGFIRQLSLHSALFVLFCYTPLVDVKISGTTLRHVDEIIYTWSLNSLTWWIILKHILIKQSSFFSNYQYLAKTYIRYNFRIHFSVIKFN